MRLAPSPAVRSGERGLRGAFAMLRHGAAAAAAPFTSPRCCCSPVAGSARAPGADEMPPWARGCAGLRPRHAAPILARSRRAADARTMMAAEDAAPNPLLQRAVHAAAGLAVMLSLMLPVYVAPEAAAAQAPAPPAAGQLKKGATAPSVDPDAPAPLGAKTIGKVALSTDESVKKIQEKAELFGEILADLQDLYVDPVDLDKLAETGFQAMLTSLDPYTEFENVEAAKVMRTQTIGNYGGVGLVITKNKDSKGKDQPYISVANAFEGYAFDAGMRVGDTLISVDGKDVKDTNTNEVSVMLKGEPGSKVVLEYKRPGLDQVQASSPSRHACVGTLRHHHASPARGSPSPLF